MANGINAKEFIDGVPSLAAEIGRLTKELSELRAEMTNVQKVFNSNSKSQGDVTKKTQALSIADQELVKIAKQTAIVTAKSTTEYKQAQKALIAKQEAQKKATAALKEEVTGAKAAAAAQKKLNKDHAEAIRINKQLEKSKAAAALKAEREEAKRLKDEQKRLNKAHEEAIKINKKHDESKKKSTSFTKKLGSAYKAALIQVTAMIVAVKAIIEAGKKYVAHIKELNLNISQTATSFQLNREEAELLTKKIRVLSSAWDQDFNETLKTSNIIAKEFGITGDKALDLISDGFRKGANINGEYLNLLKEYPAQLKSVGLSAKESIAIITQTEQQGLFSDKGIDAIKEAGIRLRELTPAAKKALEAIGLSGDEIQSKLRSGETTLFEVTQSVSEKLSELPPQSVEVGTAIADIFGGPGEDVGLRFLTTLKDIDLELGNIQSTLSPVEESSAAMKGNWQALTDEVTKGDGAASKFLATIQNAFSQNFAFIRSALTGFEQFRDVEEKAAAAAVKSAEDSEKAKEDAAKAASDAAKAAAKAAADEQKKIAKELADDQLKIDEEVEQERLTAYQLAKQKQEQINSEADQARIAQAESLSQQELDDLAQSLEDNRKLVIEAKEKEIEALNKLEEDWKDAKIKIREEAEEAAGQIVSDQITARIDENLAKFQAENDAEQDILKDRLDKGSITEEEFEKKSSALKLKSRQEEAKAEKKKALFDIAISTAVALVKQLAATPLPFGAPFLAAVAAIGLAQGVVAAAKPVPKFKDGEINIAGKRHSQGGIQAEIEQGESVINRTGTFNAPNLLTAINNGMLSDRDILLPASSAMFSGADTKELLKGFESSVINLDPLIAEQRATRKAMQNQGGTKIDQKGLQRFSEHNGTRKKHLDTFFR